jgi:nuclear transport factor 2 (NTF2) superfamily protein
MAERGAGRWAYEPAPSYRGEGEHALWHFSEDPDLRHFEPHIAKTSAEQEVAYVWAIDTRHAPAFWFPRDCPRGCAWLTSTTTDEDRVRYLGHSAATRVHVIESAWVERMQQSVLYAYRLPFEGFEPQEAFGYWATRQPVDALERVDVGDLLQRHAEAGIELRITPDLWPFWHSVIYSSLEFSASRLRNTTVPEPEPPRRSLMWPR